MLRNCVAERRGKRRTYNWTRGVSSAMRYAIYNHGTHNSDFWRDLRHILVLPLSSSPSLKCGTVTKGKRMQQSCELFEGV